MGHLRIMNALTCPWVYLPYAFPNMEWTNAYGYVVCLHVVRNVAYHCLLILYSNNCNFGYK